MTASFPIEYVGGPLDGRHETLPVAPELERPEYPPGEIWVYSQNQREGPCYQLAGQSRDGVWRYRWSK